MMDILTRTPPTADHRIAYGSDPNQFGDLWLPKASGNHRLPLVVFFHGGWWKSEYDLNYGGHLCAALKKAGIATWSVEYRRVDETGSGWPATFQDAAAGFDFATTLAKQYPLDPARVITMGHSAGGHLAFWIAGRHHIEPGSEIYEPRPQLGLAGAVALAGAVDLRMTIALAGHGVFAHDRQEVYRLMGGTPDEHPERYRAGNPGDLLPFHIPQRLIQGTADDQIPAELPEQWSQAAKRSGDTAKVSMLPGAGHFEVVDPESPAWKTVLDCIKKMLSA